MTGLVDTMELWLQNKLEDLHTALPGIVQSYNEETRLAVVKPTVKLRSMHGGSLDIPPIAGVPVLWPGNGDFSLVGNLSAGDGVLLVVSEAGIGNWIAGSGVADADDESRHTLTDCIAIPGLKQPKIVPNPSRTASWGLVGGGLELGGKDGKAVIQNEATDLRARLDAILSLLTNVDLFCTAAATATGVPYTSQATGITTAKNKNAELLV